MTITFIQGSGTATANSSTGARAYASNVTSGNKIVVIAIRYAADDNDPFVAGDCAKTAGTSTIGTVALLAEENISYNGTQFINVGQWAADVTGTGSLTVTVTGTAANYWNVVGTEIHTDGTWDAGYLEDTIINATASDNTNAASGDATSAGNAIFIGGLSTVGGGPAMTITEDGAYTLIFEQNDDDSFGAGSAIYKIVASGNTDSFDWTISNNSGWVTVGVVIKDVAAGGGSVLASDGEGEFTATGAAQASGVAAPAGEGSLDAVGASVASAVLAVDGEGEFSAAGTEVFSGVLVAEGEGDLAAQGAATASGVLSADSDSDLAAEGASVASGTLTADSEADVTFIGASIGQSEGALQADGEGDFTAVGAATAEAAFEADGEADASFTTEAEVIIPTEELPPAAVGGGGGRSGWSEAWRKLHARRRKKLMDEDEELANALRALAPEILKHHRTLH